MDLVADMVYNHRDGGFPEDNPAVKGWVTTMNATKIAAGDQPFPSDRYRCYLPLGGASPNGAGTYYFKLSSASADARFFNKTYTLTMWTNKVPVNNSLPTLTETVDNGGGDCGQASDQMYVGRK
jgi:alpha-amylase